MEPLIFYKRHLQTHKAICIPHIQINCICSGNWNQCVSVTFLTTTNRYTITKALLKCFVCIFHINRFESNRKPCMSVYSFSSKKMPTTPYRISLRSMWARGRPFRWRPVPEFSRLAIGLILFPSMPPNMERTNNSLGVVAEVNTELVR